MGTIESIIKAAVEEISDGWGEGEEEAVVKQLTPYFQSAIDASLRLRECDGLQPNVGLLAAKQAIEACLADSLDAVSMADRVRLIKTLRAATAQQTTDDDVKALQTRILQLSAEKIKLERNVKVYEQTIYVMLDSRVKG